MGRITALRPISNRKEAKMPRRKGGKRKRK